MQMMSRRKKFAKLLGFAVGLLIAAASLQAAPFNPSTVGPFDLDSKATYYDGSNGILFTAVALPTNATAMEFVVTGACSTFGGTLASPDGFTSSGSVPFTHQNTKYSGTYLGSALGTTTGDDPCLFGVFFKAGAAAVNSLDYRNNVNPTFLTQSSYAPAINQPFFIGDGLDQNNNFGATQNGQQQVFNIPAGAQFLLLGVGADDNMSDNSNPTGQTSAFHVQVLDNVPEPASAGLLVAPAAGMMLRRRRHSQAAR